MLLNKQTEQVFMILSHCGFSCAKCNLSLYREKIIKTFFSTAIAKLLKYMFAYSISHHFIASGSMHLVVGVHVYTFMCKTVTMTEIGPHPLA